MVLQYHLFSSGADEIILTYTILNIINVDQLGRDKLKTIGTIIFTEPFSNNYIFKI
jgi:hypothetical protein